MWQMQPQGSRGVNIKILAWGAALTLNRTIQNQDCAGQNKAQRTEMRTEWVTPIAQTNAHLDVKGCHENV